jgi:hypothetical protein
MSNPGTDLPTPRPRVTEILVSVALWASAAWCAALLLRSHVPFLFPEPRAVDPPREGLLAAGALQLLDGGVPALGAADSHGQLFLLSLVAAFGRVTDPLGWWPVRLCALLAGAGALLFTCWSASVSRQRVAGAVGAVAVAAALLGPRPLEAVALTPELLAASFGAAALALFLLARRRLESGRSPVAFLVASGLVGGCALVASRAGLAFAVSGGAAALVLGLLQRGRSLMGRLSGALCFGAGLAAPALAVAFAADALGGARAAETGAQAVRLAAAPAGGGPSTLPSGQQLILPLVVALLALVQIGTTLLRARRQGLARAVSERAFELLVTACALVAIAAADPQLRGRLSYLVGALPWFALLLGVTVSQVSGASRWWLRGQLSLVLLGVLALSFVRTPATPAAGQARISDGELCGAVDRWAGPTDRIFVWGHAPEVYINCKRRPASGYLTADAVTGVAPPLDDAPAQEAARVAAGARERLLEQLERTRPTVFVDLGMSLATTGRKIELYPVIHAYVDRSYCLVESRRRADVYVRKTDGRCPAGPPLAARAGGR